MKHIVYYADESNSSLHTDKIFIDKPDDAYNYMIDQINLHRKYDEDFNDENLRINKTEAYYKDPKNNKFFYYMINATDLDLYNG